jgi:hypothetical protein
MIEAFLRIERSRGEKMFHGAQKTASVLVSLDKLISLCCAKPAENFYF